tara:strand:- start:192 stop:437 length:246 start_codon:yes stop_codon:yes gene_type:complete
MARETSKPGKTARHYRSNEASRKKHVKDNSPGGKYAHSKAYKRKHAKLATKLKTKGTNKDVSKQKDGSYKAESLKINRGRK